MWLCFIPPLLGLTVLLIIATHDRVNGRSLLWFVLIYSTVSLSTAPWFARWSTLRISDSGIAGYSLVSRRVALRWSDDCHFRARWLCGIRWLEVYAAKSRRTAIVPLAALDRNSVREAIRTHLREDHPILQELNSILDPLDQAEANTN